MATPVTTSFRRDIAKAVLAQIQSQMGRGSTAYDLPSWLQIVKADLSGGRPRIYVGADEYPAVWIRYLTGGESREGAFPSRLPSFILELFVLNAVFVATPEVMGLDPTELEAFRDYSEAAADRLMSCLVHLLCNYDPGVTCAVTGYKTSSQSVTAWSYNGKATSDTRIEYVIMLRYEVAAER